MASSNVLPSVIGVVVFWTLSHSANNLLFTSTIMLGIVWGSVVGIAGSHMYVFTSDLFPTQQRALGFGLSFNLAFAFLGGTASLVDVTLVRLAPDVGPGLYWSLVSLCSTVALTVGYCARRHGHFPRQLTVKFAEKRVDVEAQNCEEESTQYADSETSNR